MAGDSYAGRRRSFLVGVTFRASHPVVFIHFSRYLPASLIFFDAVMSLSWWTPHAGQSHSRTDSGNSSNRWPHDEHNFDDGKNLSSGKYLLPYHVALYSSSGNISPNAASVMCLARLWF